MQIRNSAKAIIIKDSKLLLTKNRDTEGDFYIFPGGGQEHKESLIETLKRECIEELDATIEVFELLHIREYIGENHEHAQTDSHVHQIEFYFRCSLVDENVNGSIIRPDENQIGVEWIALHDLEDYRIYPKALKTHILKLQSEQSQEVYLGDVN